MILKQALRRAIDTLNGHLMEDAPLEAELLLRHVRSLTRTQLYLELEQELASEEEGDFWHLVERRLRHEPAAYIVGHREFYGLDLYVDPRVFIPRPETELLVEKCLEFAHRLPVDRPLIADVGTGCGAIAIAIALNLPQAGIYAIDMSDSALEIALINCQQQGVAHQVHLLQGDILHPLPGPVDIIVANLPYIKESDFSLLSAEVSDFEPELALAGGCDGLAEVHQLLAQARGKLHPWGHLLLEVGQGQAEAAVALAHGYFPYARVELAKDLGGIDRAVGITLPFEER